MSYGDKLERALVYAAQVHEDHYRKGTRVPYVTHLLAVAAIVGENGGTENEVVAALLHDAPEDPGGGARLRDIRLRFADAVAEIVAGCTDTYEDPKPPWRQRKERHLATWRAPRIRCVSSQRPTSCTTPAPCSPTTARSEKTSETASQGAGGARSGTTGPWWMRSGPNAAVPS